MSESSSFLSRWSKRKALAREADAPPAGPLPPLPPATPTAPDAASAIAPVPASAEAAEQATHAPAQPAPRPPAPTLDDVAQLTHDADYTRFMARDVTPDVQRAALKHLFSDPHFNVMDGLDTYIDDYGKPDPLPPGMLQKMVQSQLLGLFDAEPAAAHAAAASSAAAPADSPAVPSPAVAGAEPVCLPAPDAAAIDEDTDLQLQPDDAAGRTGAGECAGPHPGQQH